jgi:hypothetical protein
MHLADDVSSIISRVTRLPSSGLAVHLSPTKKEEKEQEGYLNITSVTE